MGRFSAELALAWAAASLLLVADASSSSDAQPAFIRSLSSYNYMKFERCVRVKIPENNDDDGNSYFYNGAYRSQSLPYVAYRMCSDCSLKDCDDSSFLAPLANVVDNQVAYTQGYCNSCSAQCRRRRVEEDDEGEGEGDNNNNNNNNNNSSSKNAKPKQRRVHFPKQQRALSTIAGTSTSDSMPTVWWSPQEMETMHEHAFAVVDFFAKYKVEYTHAIRTMVSQAAQSGANLVCLRTAPALTHVMGGTARGLETCTVEVLQHRRDHVRRQVLRKQHVLRQDGNNNSSNAEERARSLSLQYENLSRYASLWAQILADGDALEAAESPTASRSSATAVVGSSSNNKKSLSKSCH
mmetsp:Transcript_6332/g.14122  ORF Transcript_6332/g.14122 Transcript_6332/m.14122 type:complete len:352 (+) Transcript_6332:234-1289(+)